MCKVLVALRIRRQGSSVWKGADLVSWLTRKSPLMSDTLVLSEDFGGKERGLSAPITAHSVSLLPFAASVLSVVLAVSTCIMLARYWQDPFSACAKFRRLRAS